MYEEGLLEEEEYKEELFKIATTKKERKPERIYEPIREKEFVKLFKTTKREHHKIAFILGYGSGLRIEEIIALKPEDVNIQERKIFVRQGKGLKDRVVSSPKWLKEKHLKYLPLKTRTTRALQDVFTRISTKAGINQIIGVYKQKNGKEIPIHKYSCHSLRRGFATRLLEAGVPINQVQLLMGHKNLVTTSRYTRANPTDAINSVIERGL